VPDLVGIMDVLVHLSFREGLPRALPQAMAAGKPVVAYALDGAPEVCRQGETGHLVQPNDVKGLLHALVSLAKSPETRRSMGSHGREWVRNHFATETMVQAIEELYLRLANPSSSRHGVD
jgi:glycosyltransferase involved in cell wall biosynthesis